MADPIADRIADALVDRIKAGTGWLEPYHVEHVTRPNQFHKNYDVENLACTVQLIDVNDGSQPEINNAVALSLPFEVFVYLLMPEEDTTPIDKVALAVIEGLIDAITTPNATWHNWSGLAINSHWRQFIRRTENGAIAGCGVTVTVETRVSEYDTTATAI